MSFGTTGPNWQDENMPNGDSSEEVVELLHEDESSDSVEEQISSAEASDAEPAGAMASVPAPLNLPYNASELAPDAHEFDHQNAIDALRALDKLRSERDAHDYATNDENAFAGPNADAIQGSIANNGIYPPSHNDLHRESPSDVPESATKSHFTDRDEEEIEEEDELMHNDEDEEEEEGYDLTNENDGADDVGDDGSDAISSEPDDEGIELDSPTEREANTHPNELYSDGAISVDVRNDIPGMADHVEFPRSRATSPSTAPQQPVSFTNSRHGSPQSRPETETELLDIVGDLKNQIRDLEATQWSLERQLHQVELQYESARQEQRRYAHLAEDEASSLRQLRSTSAQEKARYEAHISELQIAANNAQLNAQTAERSLTTLRERFSHQTDVLTELRERFNQAERKQIEFETQAKSAEQAESRAQRQLELLRSQLHLALEDAAAARADLDIQAQSLAEMRAEARQEALAAIAQEVPGSEISDEQVWRKQYITLRREMDAVATEFERQEPEIAALQKAYDDAQTQLEKYQANLSQCQAEQLKLEEKLQLSEHRATDLTVFQQLSETQLNDLRRQVLVLLTEKALNSVGSPPLTPEDEDELMRLRDAVARIDDEGPAGPGSSDAGKLITERLLLFRDVAELQLQNESLLKACRELALQLDPESQAKNGALQLWETQKNSDLLQATEALEELEGKFTELKEQLLNERTSRKKTEASVAAKEQEIDRLKRRVKEAESKYQAAMQSAAEHSVATGSSSLTNDTGVANKEGKLLRLQLSTLEERVSDMRQEIAQGRDDHRDLTRDLVAARAATAQVEEKLANAQHIIADLRAQIANEQHRNAVLQQENNLVSQREQHLIVQFSQAQTEAVSFQRKIASLQQDLKDAQAQHHPEVSASNSTSPPQQTSQLEQRLEEQIQSLRTLITSQAGQTTTTESFANQEARDEAVHKAEEATLQVEKALTRVRELEQQIAELQAHSANISAQAADASRALESELEKAAARLQTQSTESAKKLAERDEVITKMRDREAELVQQINDIEDQVTEAADKADEAIKDLKLQLRQETEQVKELKRQLNDTGIKEDELAKIREELTVKLRSEIKKDELANIQDELTVELRTKIENELKQKFAAEMHKNTETENADASANLEPSRIVSRPASAEDIKSVPPGDVSAFKSALSNFVELEVLNSLEKDIENREHAKTQDYFLQQLQETKEASFKEGQDAALKQNEARKKLQQKQSEKLKKQIETLQAEIEAQKKTIRRLKFGTEGNTDSKPQNEEETPVADKSSNSTSAFGQIPAFTGGFNFNAPAFTPQQIVQQQEQPQQQQLDSQLGQEPEQPALQTSGNPFSFTQSAFPNPSSFGFDFSSSNNKRPGPFEDSEAKKRRED